MKAHALTARMLENVTFPYLVLLVSGGHCLLSVCHDPDKFSVLGSGLDDAPGEILDKVSAAVTRQVALISRSFQTRERDIFTKRLHDGNSNLTV